MKFRALIAFVSIFIFTLNNSYAENLPDDNQLLDSWHHSKIQTFEGWKVEPGSPEIIVAIMDDGMNTASLYPSEVLAPRLWQNSPELNGDNSIDDDENGFIDDINGWDFADNDNSLNHDGADHGTRMASIVVGVSPNTSLMAVKIVDDAEQLKYIVGAYEIFKYAVDNGARVINISWGFLDGVMDQESLQEVKDGIDYANQHGVLVVAGSGNNATNTDIKPFYPASLDYPNIISVAGTTQSDGMYSNSNYGINTVDVAAPGSDIACLTNFNFPKHDTGKYKTSSGTSTSTAIVSGLAALLFSQDPSRTAADVKNIIMNSVDVLPILDGKVASGGRVNVLKALNYDSNNDKPSITLIGASEIHLNVDDKYIEYGATAKDYQDGDISGLVSISGDIVDTSTAGTYKVRYDVVDSDGNSANPVYRTVIITDPSECKTFQSSLIEHENNSRAYSEETGYWWYKTTTWYAEGSDVKLGTNGEDIVALYQLSEGDDWNIGTCPGEDAVPPTISLIGNNPMTIQINSEFIDPGVTASDDVDGDLTDSVIVTGEVDVTTTGTYYLTYSVSDSSGNNAETTREVVVIDGISEWTATCLEHEEAGRSYRSEKTFWIWTFTTWYAVGSDDYLGNSGSATKTLTESPDEPGVYYLK